MRTYSINITFVYEGVTIEKDRLFWLSIGRTPYELTKEKMYAITGNGENLFTKKLKAILAVDKIISALPDIIDDARAILDKSIGEDGGIAINIIAHDPDARGPLYGDPEEKDLGGYFIYRRDIPAQGRVRSSKTYHITSSYEKVFSMSFWPRWKSSRYKEREPGGLPWFGKRKRQRRNAQKDYYD